MVPRDALAARVVTLGDGLLFLHGAGGRPLVWQHQLLAFPRARAVDLPGRGEVPWEDGPATVDTYLAALRRHLGPPGPAGPRILAGHSLGGAIALWWALRYPEEVRALVLVGTGARMRVAPAFLGGIAAGDAAALEAFGAMWFGSQAPLRLRDHSLALLRATPAPLLSADLRAADGFDVMAEVDALAQPALVICGADDRLTPVKYSRYLHDRIRGSTLVVVEGAGHMVMLERPEAVNAAIGAFLERLDALGPARAPEIAPGGRPA